MKAANKVRLGTTCIETTLDVKQAAITTYPLWMFFKLSPHKIHYKLTSCGKFVKKLYLVFSPDKPSQT